MEMRSLNNNKLFYFHANNNIQLNISTANYIYINIYKQIFTEKLCIKVILFIYFIF